jgi:putative nucleotidyltransferase with HDIG domain
VEALQSHSLRTAALAKQIAGFERLSKAAVEEAFLAGMLHDVGKLVLALNCLREYEECIAFARDKTVPTVEAESNAFGITHAEVGMYLLRLWGLPDTVADAVAFHHYPSRSKVRGLGALVIVHVANFLVGKSEGRPTLDLDVSYLSEWNGGWRVEEWRTLSSETAEGAAL